MPLNVRRFCTSILVSLVGFVIFSHAQTVTPPSVPPQQAPVQQAPVNGPTSGDVMRERISKAKAFIVVRNYNAAIYELENIRKETSDAAVQGVVNVLLMNSYLEQGDFKRGQEMLTEFYNLTKTTRPNAHNSYMSVAGQVVKGARSRAERYKALGLNINDRTLPLEALNDLEKMRETVELVITHSKEIGKVTAKTADAMMMLEEASASRSMIARDDYDAKRWKEEVADTREQMANSRSVVMSAVNDPNAPATTELVAEIKPAPPVTEPKIEQPKDTTVRAREVNGSSSAPPVATETPVYVPASQPIVDKPKPPTEEPKTIVMVPNAAPGNAPVNTSPLDVGALLPYATNKAPVQVPQIAKMQRLSGEVKVDILVDEKGLVSQIQKTTGPPLLQGAAKDAIKKWKFTPFLRDGHPVKATGFVSFNFNL